MVAVLKSEGETLYVELLQVSLIEVRDSQGGMKRIRIIIDGGRHDLDISSEAAETLVSNWLKFHQLPYMAEDGKANCG